MERYSKLLPGLVDWTRRKRRNVYRKTLGVVIFL